VERKVVFRSRAVDSMNGLYDYIAAESGPVVARNYINRIYDYCESFAVFPERGTRREDIATGVRKIGFERRVTIVFRVLADRVEIMKVAYGGRNWEAPEGDISARPTSDDD
jgi:toxin ParE1/3/4